MRTGINPLDGEYDIDDGVYLGLGTDKVIVADSLKPYTVGSWRPPKALPMSRHKTKPTCVRVRYAGNYHLDLPIYAMSASDVPDFFKKGSEPFESDPRGFTTWFQERVNRHGQQLRYIVRYLKAWRDYQQGGAVVASGLALTILTANHFTADDRDDVALVKTVEAIYTYIEWGGSITKPVTPYEDLAADWTDNQRANFLTKLKNLRDRGRDALDEEEKSVASGIWQASG